MLVAAHGEVQGGQEGFGAVLAFRQPRRQGPDLPDSSAPQGSPLARAWGAEGGDATGATGPLPAQGGVSHSLTSAAPHASLGWVLLVLSFAGG